MSAAELGFRPDLTWEKVPPGIEHRDVAAVAVDSADRVHLFTRFDHQVLVYTADGSFIRSWGKGIFKNAHGIRIGPDDAVYCVDNGDHSLRKFTPDGELLLILGNPGMPSDTGYQADQPVRIHPVERVRYPGPPFNGCTDLAIAPTGDIFVTDGYGNCRIHHFSPHGELLHSWGEVGAGPGQFRLPHAICMSADGRLFVADRENDRIQIFSTDGDYLGEWGDLQRPCSIAFAPDGTMFVAELWRPVGNRSFVRDDGPVDLPSRMSVLSPDGKVIARWGGSATDKAAAGNFIAPHSVTIDSQGNLYVAEVTYTFAIKTGLVSADHAAHQVQKFQRTSIRQVR